MLNVFFNFNRFYVIKRMFFIFRLLVWDLSAHRTQGWALCTLNLQTKVDGPEHTGAKDHLLMEDTGSILHIHTLMPEEAGFYLHILSLEKIMSHKPSSLFSCYDSTDAQVFRDSGRESDVEGLSPLAGTAGFTPVPPAGSVMYDHPVPGLPIGSSTVLYGPPLDGARLLYGPPSGGLTVPLVPSGTLHCNVPGHQDLVSCFLYFNYMMT